MRLAQHRPIRLRRSALMVEGWTENGIIRRAPLMTRLLRAKLNPNEILGSIRQSLVKYRIADPDHDPRYRSSDASARPCISRDEAVNFAFFQSRLLGATPT